MVVFRLIKEHLVHTEAGGKYYQTFTCSNVMHQNIWSPSVIHKIRLSVSNNIDVLRANLYNSIGSSFSPSPSVLPKVTRSFPRLK